MIYKYVYIHRRASLPAVVIVRLYVEDVYVLVW